MPGLGWWLEHFQTTAFRLECLSAYVVPEEAEMWATFKRTGKAVVADDHPWPPLVRAATEAGKKIQRVRVVTAPLSDYQRYELVLYPHSASCGEDIRILDDPSFDFKDDFWLLDDEFCFVMRYTKNGEFLRAEQVPPGPYRARRQPALARSMPLADFTARITQ
jgi:hypothetical protein